MRQEGNTFIADKGKTLVVEKANYIGTAYTIGTALFPVDGELVPLTTTKDDIIECYLVDIDGVQYKIQADDYSQLVSGLIRLKYSIDDELAMIANYRNGNTDPEKEYKFQEWRSFCKNKAKSILNE